MAAVQIYLILGPTGAGRRVVLADLVRHGLPAETRPVVFVAGSEIPPSEAEAESLAAVPGLMSGEWTMEEGRFTAQIPSEATHVFVVTDGRANPIDQIEAFHAWVPGSGAELARVITVIDCQLGSKHLEVLRWYDACVHFSDVVLLNRREGVPNKWISDFIARFRKQHYPCLIEPVKRGEVANPALILEPQARRISLLFDETAPVTVAVSTDGDEEEFEDDADEEIVAEEGVPVDPYIERLAGSGRRAKEIPDIAKFV